MITRLSVSKTAGEYFQKGKGQMKKKSRLAVILGLAILLLAACEKKTQEQYDLLNLSIGDTEERVIDLYGEPEGRCYEVVGTYPLQDQSLYTYLIYEDKTITVRSFLEQSEEYASYNGVIEIDVYGGSYETSEGIKIGDSINDVIAKYGSSRVYDYGEKDGLVSELIANRVEHTETYEDRDFLYDYGKIDKIAYILSPEKDEEHCNIPALIFLISEGKVTHIITTNTLT